MSTVSALSDNPALAPLARGSALAALNPRRWGSTFAALHERHYAWFFAGNIAFFMGMQMQQILRGYLAFKLTDSASALGLMAAAMAIPMLIVSPFGGVLADRVNKRRLLILTQTGSAVVSLLLAALIIADVVVFWHLLATSVVTGIIFSFNMPARQALVPQLVPQHLLMNAISLQMGGMNATRVLAPALGGLLIAPLGVGWVYLLTFALFSLAAASEFHLPQHGMVAIQQRKRFREDFLEGFRYILQNRTILLLISLGLVFPLFAFPLQQMLPVFAEDVFHKGGSGLGILAAATGVGGLIGAMIAANMDGISQKGRLMCISGLWMGVLFVVFTQTPAFVPALIFLAIGNIGGMVFQTVNNTSIQANLPAEVRGRVMAVTMMSFGLMPLGVLPTAAAADAFGASTAVAGASVLLILTVAGFFFFSSRLRGLRLDRLTRAELSPAQAAVLLAQGTISQADADRLTGRIAAPFAVAASAAPALPPPPALAAPLRPPLREELPVPFTPPLPRIPLRWPPRRSPRLAFLLSSALGVGILLGFTASAWGEILRTFRATLAQILDPDD